MNTIHHMQWSIGKMEEFRELTTTQEVPPRRELEIKIEAAQLAIARLRETPFQNSLEQKTERLNQLYREYAFSFGVG